jgi:hypothetical protein
MSDYNAKKTKWKKKILLKILGLKKETSRQNEEI